MSRTHGNKAVLIDTSDGGYILSSVKPPSLIRPSEGWNSKNFLKAYEKWVEDYCDLVIRELRPSGTQESAMEFEE